MFNIKLLDLFFLLFAILFIASCANIHPPSGGPIDETPPQLIQGKSFPKNNSTNYKGRTIDLTFDEDINTQNIAEQLLITPLEDNSYKVLQRKNKLRLEFEKDFQANTTYTFNFRESVRDITESNPARNLNLAFSTGPFLDSIFLSGKVKDLLTNLPQGNILVSLYIKNDTLSPLNSKPVYLSKTEKDGTYFIKNVKQGTYKLYAIDDKNKNLLLDDREKLAFRESFNLDSSQSKINLSLSPFDYKAPQIKNARPSENVVFINLSEGVEKASLTIPEDTTKAVVFNLSKDGKIINVYNTFDYNDSIPLNIQLIDSIGNSTEEEIKIIFSEQQPGKKGKRTEDPLFEILPYDRKLNPGEANIQLRFNKPVIKSALEKIFIKGDSVTHKISKENISWENNTVLNINKKINAKDSVVLTIEENTFVTIDTSNTKQEAKFQFKKEEEYGKISGAIKTKEKFIIELLDYNYKIISSLSNTKTFSFDYLPPGSYYIRVLVDENNNGKWDTLDLLKGIQPEPVFFYKEKIELRANWEVQDIVIQF